MQFLPSMQADQLGFAGGKSGPSIQLSNATFNAGAAQGTVIGALSVVNGTGTWTFSLTDTHSNAVQISGSNLQVGSAASSAGSFSITVSATNGTSTINRTFLITANSVAPSGNNLSLQFNQSPAFMSHFMGIF